MPLAVGQKTLESDLAAMYADVGGEKAAAIFAKKKAQAIHDFAITGIPMTILTNSPGAVAGGVTAGPVMATGIGGIDKPAPGMGLDAAKVIFEKSLVALWTHGGANVSAAVYAKQYSMLVLAYLSEAIVSTIDTSNAPLPAPPPAGPVTGPMTGIGGLAGPAPGSGLSSAKADLESALKAIYSDVDSAKSVAEQAKKEVEAIHNFCIQAKIDTIGVILAPAAVAPPPAPPAGGYFPGTGTATGTIS